SIMPAGERFTGRDWRPGLGPPLGCAPDRRGLAARWEPAELGGAIPVTARSAITPRPVDLPLAHEQRFDLGALAELRTVSTPGHPLGHCPLLLSSRNLLILGDALANRTGSPRVPRAVLNDDNDLVHRTAPALALPDVDALAFGHGAPILAGGDTCLQDVARTSKAYLARKTRA
ncbi:MAG TPA: hypothetical protein VGP82_00865, partial [Ktedonobacterales bacterium]|nr:hypothetical protein [Ktedonobacterales bacterium]